MKKRQQPGRVILRVTYLFILLLLSLSLKAQLNSGNLMQISEKDGLSSNNVNGVLVDDLGYIWIATYNGLAKYNGYEAEKFYSNPNDTTAIQGLVTYRILQSRDGRIWMGTNPGYIEVYDPATRGFTHFYYSALEESLGGPSPLYGYLVTSMCEDDRGNLYFGISTGGVEEVPSGLLWKSTDDTTIRPFTTPPGQDIHDVIRIRKDKQGNIWVLSYSGMYKIDPDGRMTNINAVWKRIPALEDEYSADFDLSIDNQIVVVSQYGRIVKVDPLAGTFRELNSNLFGREPTQQVSAMIADTSGHFWIGSRAGAWLFLPETGEFRSFNTGARKQLEKIAVNNFFLDRSGNLYIATANSGVLRYEDKSLFNSFIGSTTDKQSILPGWANILYEASDGKIWVHTDAGFSIMDRSASKVLVRSGSAVSSVLGYSHCFWEYEPGLFYFSRGNGELYRFSETSFKPQRTTLPGLPANLVISCHMVDHNGDEWLGTRGGLFNRKRGSSAFARIDLPPAESDANSNDITGLVNSRHGGIWIVSNNGLFFRNNKTGVIDRYGNDKTRGDVFISQDINTLYEDKNGIVWVGQWQGGLARLDFTTRKIRNYTVKDGLASMGVQSVLGDEKTGMLWISTFNGMSRFDPMKEQFSNYSLEDGLQGALFADGAALKTSSGLFIFGGSNGITVFNPDKMKVKNDPPKVFLTDLRLFNKSVLPGPGSILQKPVYQTEKIVLDHDQNSISIEFIALHYDNPLKNRYAFTMENFDPDWREGVNQRQAFYPNLPPGKYVFRVKAANDKGVWNEKGASLVIIVNPPWWQTWWAYCIYGIAFVILIFLVHGYQKRQVIAREREHARTKELEQAKKIEKAYHELRAAQQQLIHAEKMASLGELTAGIAHEIQNPLNFVNNFSEVNRELLEEQKEELEKGNLAEAGRIADEVSENEQKIAYHGKRADAIVKSMLQHSRSSGGKKEPTDINALVEEYTRLAYHGIRARDKSFNATYTTGLDPAAGTINVVPQDIGRVVLNLVNNAFQAAAEKSVSADGDFRPLVKVSTRRIEGKVEVKVEDNGAGIPEAIKEKIFQPFFTTKPTGQGTGLGLSLSYDIVKAHGGTIIVTSKEARRDDPVGRGEGTVFVVQLPIQNTV